MVCSQGLACYLRRHRRQFKHIRGCSMGGDEWRRRPQIPRARQGCTGLSSVIPGSAPMSEKLREEVAGLEAAARAYTARHQRIDNLTWPNGARIAVNFTADFDAMLLRRLNNEPAMQLAKGEFGGRVGIWRLIELFDSHRIKATVFTVGRICELYPKALRAAVRSGHELADHMWEHR